MILKAQIGARLGLAVGLVLSTLVLGGTAVVDSSDNFVTLLDVHGPDDINGQSDLVSTELDSGHLDDPDPTLWVRWTWDETGWSGKNTGDACALFDTDGDGNANHAVCVTVGGNPAAQTADSPRLYECTADSRNDRCAGDNEITTLQSSCTAVISGGDTIATCEIDMDDVGGGAAVLLNTCSFNSREPNSNPPDCVLEPGMGVTVIKDVTDDAAVTSGFEVTVDGSGVIPESIVGDGTFFVPLTNGTHGVAEVEVPAGYELASSTCTSGSPSVFTLTLGAVEAVSCTFVNSPVGAVSMAVTKSFAAATVDAGTTGNTFTIAVDNDGTSDLTDVVVTDLVDPLLTVTGVGADLGGDCSATVGNSVSCTIATLAAGQTATVTVTYAVAETVEPTTVSNTASVVANEVGTPQTSVDSVAIAEDVVLDVVKSFTADPVAAGTTSNSFTIAVTNGGSSDAENVVLTDVVDSSLAVTSVAISPVGDCSASTGQTVDCTIADLAASSSATITVTYDVAESAGSARISNVASATSDEVTTPVTGAASVDVVEDVDLVVVKAFAVDPIVAGSTDQTFSITVTNNGTSDAENVSITDTVAAPLVVTAVGSTSADCSASTGQTVDCAVAALGSGQSATVVVTFDVAESASPATISNTASATSDEVVSPVTGADSLDVVEDVAFNVVKTFGTASAPAGSTGLTFAIEVTNTGLSDAENVRITDPVDAALTVAGVSSTGADCSASAGQTVDCTVAMLAAGATVTVTVVYDIDESVDPGTIGNTTSVVSDEVTVPITGTGSTEVTEDVAVTATKVFSPPTAAAGSTGNAFVLTVTNTGLSDADNVAITDLVDAALQVDTVAASAGDCSASTGQTVSCTIGSLGGGQTVVVTVTYSLGPGVTPGPITNSMDASFDEGSTSASSSVDVVADVDFLVTKTFDAGSVVAGSTGHTFTISVTNSESSDATGVTISDAVDAALTVTGVSSPTADCSGSSGQTVDCSLATLPAGETATVTVTFDVDSTVDAATIANTVSVDANEIPAPVTADDTVDVVEDVSLSATKTFTDATVAAGSTGHTFTLVVSNGGASDADNVTIDDVVAAELVVTSVASPDADCSTSAGQTISCTTPSLPGGGSMTVTVGYDVAVSAEAATVSNNVAVGSDEAAVSASDSIDVIEDVVLEMTKTFADSTVAAGVSGSTFSITLTNTGISDAEAVSITDAVAPELAVTSVTSPDADCSASTGQVVDCAIPSLAPGGSATVTVAYDVDESAAPGTVSNTANTSSDEDATSATDSVEVVEDVDLAVTKTFSPAGAVAGSSGNSFTIAVTNLGVSDAENVLITDAVDPALTVTGAAAAPAGDCSATVGNAVDCAVAVLAAGATVTLTVIYDVPSTTDTSTISNTAAVTSDEVGPITGSDDVAITEDVSLAASKTFDPTTVVAGSTGHSFTVEVTNSGISTADSVTVVDTVDSALDVTSVSISPIGDCSASSGNSVDCTITSLGAGQTATATVTFDVPPGTDSGVVANTASVDSDELASPLAPTDTVDITEDVALTVTKVFTPATVAAGTSGHQFTITATNSGTSDADNVTITDTVDATLAVISASIAPAGSCAPVVANVVDCTLASLDPGDTAVVTVSYDVPASATAGTIANTAGATSDEVTSPATGSDTVTVVEDVVLEVTKAFAVDPVIAGSSANTFSVTVANTGTSDANDVTISDVVDAGLTVTGVSIAPSGDCSTTTGNNVACTIAVLAPAASATVTVTYDVAESAESGSVANTASVVSDEITTPATGSATVTVSENVVLDASKAFAADPVVAGSTGNTFTIAVTNSGMSDADDVTIIDTVDAALSVTAVSIAPSGDCTASSGNAVDCTVPSLGAGSSATVTVTYDVPESADPATIANTASVASDEILTPLTPSDDVTIVEDVDLSITKTFATTTATAGTGGHSFSIAVTNTGRSDAEDVRISDAVDPDLTVVGVTAASGDCSASAGQDIDCTFATLGSGATATAIVRYDIGATVTTPQTVANTGTATSDETTTPVTASDTLDVNAVVAFDSEKVFAASTVAAGSTGNTFTIAVTNSGPSDSSGITIDDTVDPRLQVTDVAIDPIGDCSASADQTIDCTIATMVVGESTVVTVTYDVAESVEAATITNTAVVDSTVPASSTIVSTSVDVVEDVDLSVNKAFSAGPVAAGSTGNSFSIAVTNAGLSDAENIVVTDLVDTALTVTAVSIGPSGDCSATTGNTISCTLATLARGSTATVTVLYDVGESVTPQLVGNTAGVTSDEVTTPVTGSSTIEIVEDVILTATKTFASGSVAAGTSGNSFTVTVTNTGRSDAENVVVTDAVDGTLNVTSSSMTPAGDCSATVGNAVSCTVPVLAAGSSATVTVSYDVPASAAAGIVTNTAGATSDEVTTPVTGSDTVDVVKDVDLTVTKTFSTPAVTAGTGGHTFTIAVTNAGSSDAANVVIADTVDPALTVAGVTAAPTGDCTASAGNSISCDVATLTAGTTVIVTVTYAVPATTDTTTISNTATATSDEVTTPVADTATVDAIEDVDLAVTKTFAAATATAGTTGHTLTITATNSGSSDADNVTITDSVDPALTVTDASVDSAGDCSATSGNAVSCTVASLAPGATATLTITYDITESVDPATVTNTATVASDETTTPLTASDTVDVVEDVTLNVVKTFGATAVAAGTGGHTFTIAVTNTGPSDAENVRISDDVDAALSVTAVVSAPAGDCSASTGNSVDCTVTKLAAGATATVTVTYDVDESTDTATISNTASATSDEVTTPVTGSDTVDAVENVDLSVTKTFADASVVAGSTGNTFTIAVTNNGTSDAENLVVTDNVDSALTVTGATIAPAGDCSATTANSVSCTMSSLGAGANATVTVTYDVAASVDPGTVANTAAAMSDELSTAVEDSTTINITEDVTLTAVKTFETATVIAGIGGHTFTIEVANEGTSDAENVRISDLVDATLTVTGATIAPAGDCSATTGNDVDCTVPSLAPGASATVTVTFDVAADVIPATVTNTADVTSDEVTTPVTSSTSVDVTAATDLAVAKTSSPDPYVPGDTITYTIVVSNAGPSTASAIGLTEVLPDDLTDVTFAPSAGDYDAASGNWSGLTIPAGGTATLIVTATVPADQLGAVINTVVVDPPDGTSDPDPSNNTAIDQNPTDVEADLAVTKDLDTTDPTPGGPVAWTIVVTNEGTGVAIDAAVSDPIVSMVHDVTWTCSATGSIVAACGTNSGLGDLATVVSLLPGDTATFKVNGTLAADAHGELANTARVRLDGDPDATDNSATAMSVVQELADLELDKSAQVPSVDAGDTVTYELTATSRGPSIARGTTITDDLPSGTIFVAAASPNATCSHSNGVVTCATRDLAAFETVVVTIEVLVLATTDGGQLVNAASITSTTSDPVVTNNAAQATVDVRPSAPPPAGATTPQSGDTPQNGDLPQTGAADGPYLVRIAMMLLIAGLGLLVTGRRRRART